MHTIVLKQNVHAHFPVRPLQFEHTEQVFCVYVHGSASTGPIGLQKPTPMQYAIFLRSDFDTELPKHRPLQEWRSPPDQGLYPQTPLNPHAVAMQGSANAKVRSDQIITGSPAGLSRVNGNGKCSTKMINFDHLPKSQLWIIWPESCQGWFCHAVYQPCQVWLGSY